MTAVASCAVMRDHLHAFLDGELHAADHAAVLAHIDVCPACAADLESYRALGGALRAGAVASATAAPAGTVAALEAMTSRVVSLTAAEARESLRSRVAAAFEDMRFVFAGAGSFAATLACAVGLAAILQASSVSRNDSLASLMGRMAAPRGSTENPYSVDPRIMPPTLQQGLVMPAILVDDVPYAVPDEEYAFSGVLTSDGRVAGIEMLQSGGQIDSRALELLYSIHESRFRPATKDGRAVAVSFVWLHSDVTIKPQKSL